MNQIGLVLAGGGGKGAYQIGVWKYLRETGLDRYVGGVSGTSVGALNAALFATGDYATAERIWKNISPEQVLSSRGPVYASMMSGAPLAGALSIIPRSRLERALNESVNQALFTHDGLLHIMRQYVDMGKVQRSEIPCYATCLDISGILPEVKRFELRRYPKKSIETLLLASSAIPFIFDSVRFEGRLYCDGGIPLVGDNVPLSPLYKRGLRFFIVVHLDRDVKIDRTQFPGAFILEVVPQKDLGNPLTGVLDFSPSGTARRIEQGYHDVKCVFDDYFHHHAQNKK